MPRWLLPEYIEDILPQEAGCIETLRRDMLSLFRSHGYELVVPPLLEYVESLLTGTGHDLDLRTLKLVDQLSGRLLGLRADITPQVARIDAHLLNRQGITRLCYVGSVLHALPSGLNSTREPLQAGAELYGHAGVESDQEIQALMLGSLAAAGIADLRLDLGHVAVFRSLVRHGEIGPELERELFQVLQYKDVPALKDLVRPLGAISREALLLLPELYGGREVLTTAAQRLPAHPEIGRALEDLRVLGADPGMEVGLRCFDLAELHGYHYHSGVVFAAYAPGHPNAIARGGRYDHVGVAFGRARPATGFSVDLRVLAGLTPALAPTRRVLAPHRPDDAALQTRIAQLRAQGEVVIVDLPGHEATRGELGCDRRLDRVQGRWETVDEAPVPVSVPGTSKQN